MGKYDSDQVSRGGAVILYGRNGKDEYLLNLEGFLTGFHHAVARHIVSSLYNEGKVTTYILYAKTCDEIIQYAIFGEIRFPYRDEDGGSCYGN